MERNNMLSVSADLLGTIEKRNDQGYLPTRCDVVSPRLSVQKRVRQYRIIELLIRRGLVVPKQTATGRRLLVTLAGRRELHRTRTIRKETV